jgi:outer membrane protein assembly factor BamA
MTDRTTTTTTTTVTVSADRPRHVILFGVYRWHTRQYSDNPTLFTGAADTSVLREYVGPIQYYSHERVQRHLSELRASGYVSSVEINNTTVGVELTASGRELLTDLGVPTHFNH